jgi:DnaJ-class molecular chaperone
MKRIENYYKILNVHPKASQAEIKERFRFLANAYHPDKFVNSTHKAQAEAEFKKINEAYQVLSVPLKRAEYDRRVGLTQSPRVENERKQSSHNSGDTPDALSFLRSLITSIVAMLLLYLALFIVAKLGFGGLILVLILAGVILSKVYWR